MRTWRLKLGGAEFKVMRLQDAPTLEQVTTDTGQAIVDYLLPQLPGSIRYSPETENLIVVLLNTRRRPIGWEVISNGTLDTLLFHPRELFRPAVLLNASALVMVHNHPSGDPTPSESDIKVTRQAIAAGNVMKIDVLDHIILGQPSPDRSKAWVSLRELGYFYTS